MDKDAWEAEPQELVPPQIVKNPPAVLETLVRSLSWEDPLEEGLAMHSSILAWRMSMDIGAWWGTDDGIAESDTEQLTKHSVWASRYNEGVEGPQRGGWGFRAGGSQPNALEKGLGLGWGWEGSVTTFPAPSSVCFCGLQKGAH